MLFELIFMHPVLWGPEFDVYFYLLVIGNIVRVLKSEMFFMGKMNTC